MVNMYKLIQLNSIVQNHRIKYFYTFLAHTFGWRHLFVRFDPVFACNINCTMCYFSDTEFRKSHKGMFKEADVTRIAELFFPQSLQVQIGCAAEPTLYKNFTDIIHLAKLYKVPSVKFISNCQLLSEDNIATFIQLGLDELMVSVHGVHKETYEKFMVRASYERFREVLETIERLKKHHNTQRPRLRFNYTANPDNVEDLLDFFTVFSGYTIDTLQVRPMFQFDASTGYQQGFVQAEDITRYNQIAAYLIDACHTRGVRLLINTIDPSYQSADGYQNVILKAVERYISPEIVWRDDFDWRQETYQEYCRRIQWSKYLWYCASLSKEQISAQITGTSFVGGTGNYQARYSVFS